MNSRIAVTLLVGLWGISACGGGTSPAGPGGPSSGPASPPPAEVDESIGGLWSGLLTSDDGFVVEEYVGMSSADGRFRFMSVDSDVHFIGVAEADGTSLTATARAFAATGGNWLDGNHVVDATLTAVISQRDSISGSWVLSSGESGTFDFLYDPLYEKNSPTGLLESVRTGYDSSGNAEISFTIDADGAFSGQDTTGCVSVGQFTVLDPAFNLFEIQSDISNCGIAGGYTGFAFLVDLYAINDALVISIDDGQQPILMALGR
jgi:hypothetical protein